MTYVPDPTDPVEVAAKRVREDAQRRVKAARDEADRLAFPEFVLRFVPAQVWDWSPYIPAVSTAPTSEWGAELRELASIDKYSHRFRVRPGLEIELDLGCDEDMVRMSAAPYWNGPQMRQFLELAGATVRPYGEEPGPRHERNLPELEKLLGVKLTP